MEVLHVFIEITPLQGEPYDVEVQQIRFVNRCPHCGNRFKTLDYRKLYPNKSHRDMDKRYRRIVREL